MTTATRHYTDSSDNPSWIETTKPDGSTETLRYTSSISGDLGASIASDGGVSLMLPSIRDDIATTVPIPAGTPATTPATTIAGWSSYTEYGTPIDPAQTATVGTSAGYGWLGAKERSTTAETANLTLMGVRFYNRITGAFTSVDPVPGGNATAYNYPTDPVNQSDLDGNKGKWKKRLKSAGRWAWKNKTKIASGVALGACVVLSAGACAVAAVGAAAISIGSNAYKKKKLGKRYSWGSFAKDTALDVALAAVPGFRYGRGAVGTVKKAYKYMRGHRATHRFPLNGGKSARATTRSHRMTYRQSYVASYKAGPKRWWAATAATGYGAWRTYR